MLAFIVPVKPKFNSKNWENDNKLLNRTLISLCNQTNNDFKVYIVYHEKPEVKFSHPNLRFIPFPFKYTVSEHIEDLQNYALKYYGRKYAEYMFDKGKKIMFGCKVAIEEDSCFLMAVDSDDLVSNKISEFVNASSIASPGWVIEKGYIYLEGSKFLIRSDYLQGINGSTHIINRDFIPIPDFDDNRLFNFNFFEAHGYVRRRVEEMYQEHLQALPFHGTIYMVHKDNTSNVSRIISNRQLKTFFKYLIRGRLLTNSIRRQFGLYNL